MSAATASITDVSRTDFTNRDGSLGQKNSGQSQTQCTPMPLPTLGTQKIIQGNGTSVGTVISLQCPAKHTLVGSDLTCVMGGNSSYWVGKTYCKPMSTHEDYGFRVAVLASVVSSAIIMLMSVAFITCCLLECIKEDKKKTQEKESDVLQWEEQAQQRQENNRFHYSHKGRNNNNNNNNNNTQDKVLTLWDPCDSAVCDSLLAYRCHQQYTLGPVGTYGPTPLLSPLPGHNHFHPLLPQNPESTHIYGPPPQYFEPSEPCYQTLYPAQDHISTAGPLWKYGQQRSPSAMNPTTTNERSTAKEFSIRIISV